MADPHRKLKSSSDENAVDVLRHVFEYYKIVVLNKEGINARS